MRAGVRADPAYSSRVSEAQSRQSSQFASLSQSVATPRECALVSLRTFARHDARLRSTRRRDARMADDARTRATTPTISDCVASSSADQPATPGLDEALIEAVGRAGKERSLLLRAEAEYERFVNDARCVERSDGRNAHATAPRG